MSFTDYTSAPAGSPVGGTSVAPDSNDYASLGKLKGWYLDYLSTKTEEVAEQKASRKYRHGSQYTSTQVETLNKRKQPVVTYNRVSRKIDAVVGLVEKLRQDPKAYPRTPQQEKGAELATAVLRYVLDEQEWKAKSPIIASDGATEGIGGLEIVIERGDQGDPEIAFEIVETDGFFYDPRSARLDFSDARYMGMGKWIDVELAKEMFPDKADKLEAALDGAELSSNSDREQKWFSSALGRVRIVDHWYKHKGEWCFCIYTGSMKLAEGKSYLFNEKNKTICKFIMFSANVDHDGDRYGFVRQLKSAQDEINARRSKGLFELNTRRIIAEKGAFDDIEIARREAARPDGVVERNPGMDAQFDDANKMANIEGAFKFLEEAKNEIENFGPNPALLGQGIENSSGRAISLLQQAGIAELGPYILAYRGWKIRVYRALFCAIQRYWTAERWIRVTDDNDLAQFIQVNGVGLDPRTGMPTIVNALGTLDVDIILDEGPDQMNMMGDAYDTLSVLASKGAQVPPQVLIELSPLQMSVKKRILDMMQRASQPGPAQQLELAQGQAKVNETNASAGLKDAQRVKTLVEAGRPDQQQDDKFELPPFLQMRKAVAEINEKDARANHIQAQADKTNQDTALAPIQFAHDVHSAEADRQLAEDQAKQRTATAANRFRE